MATIVQPVGQSLRQWRQHRKMSQLELALDADVSARHLSFVETGRAQPSRDMLLRLAGHLDVPFRDRNALLLAGGFAPVFDERPFDSPELATVRQTIDQLLSAHEPYPALAVDRHWTMLAANRAVPWLVGDVDPALLEPPVNVLRLSLHPRGMGPRIRNFAEWRSHVLHGLRRQHRSTADPALAELADELAAYPGPGPAERDKTDGLCVPLRLASADGDLSFISTTTVFGTPLNVTLSEMALETFFPADDATRAALRAQFNAKE